MFLTLSFEVLSFPPNQVPNGIYLTYRVLFIFLLLACCIGIVVSLTTTPRLWRLALWPLLPIIGYWLASTYEPTYRNTDGMNAFAAAVAVLAGLVFVIELLRLAKSLFLLWALILLFLAGVFFWPLTHSVRSTKRTDCMNQLRQIGIALHNLHDASHRFPDQQISNNGGPIRSWRIQVLPFLERSDVFDEYNQDFAWDSAENFQLAKVNLSEYRCPSVKHDQNIHDNFGRYFTHYLAVTGPETAFANGKGMTLEEISDGDGTNDTMLLVEASGRNIVWTDPRDADTSVQSFGINVPGENIYESSGLLSSYHPSGANVSMADASVRFIRKDIDPKILKALTTVRGNDPVDRGF